MTSHLLSILFLSSPIFAAFMKSHYVVDMEGGFLCPDNDQLQVPMRKYRVDRINRTHRAISLDFTLVHAVDNTVEATMAMERASDGGWTNLPLFPYQKDPCRQIMRNPLQELRDMFVKFAKALGLKHPETCDIPAGNYSVDRYPIEVSGTVPFWGGRYRSTVMMRMVKDKKKIFCIGSIFSTREVSD